MAAATTPAAPEHTVQAPLSGLDDGPPHIEGFNPSHLTRDETFREKLERKTKENPFVPIGCLATAGALIFGLRSFQQGNTRHSQLLMRGRIAAQGFTVFAIIVGVLSTALRTKQ
ncbi:HIG1 domain family member 2A, mitochondrial [Paralichthys olivaceus]|uniref:HIG1 domain family member 2A, mitochondrial n=1 Tax=Paralichthys olivaceus TaxID=8255 RepID=UPI00097DB0E8|nr:PREDICTED: HIG1 domain family member 2A, mitochondrial [Paralichthys olivaceus]